MTTLRRALADPRHLQALAKRWSRLCNLPLPLAHKRVQALAVSAAPHTWGGPGAVTP
jgi:hypothetical protein